MFRSFGCRQCRQVIRPQRGNFHSDHLVDTVSAGGGCEAAVTVRTRCGWVKFRECSELLYGWRFPLWPKGAVYLSYVIPAILYVKHSA